MDTIYKHAVLTIVAAMDENAPLGLPGVSVPRSKPRVFSFGQHTLLRTPDPRKTITASKWQTRGWTYQEMLLSRYRLVFTSDQVYFQCAMASCIEGQRVPEMEHFEYQVFPDPLIDKNINTLYDRIEEYSRRELSFDTDTINALIGVFNVYRESSSTVDSRGAINHFYGVPISWRRCSGPESWCASMTLGLDWRVGEKDVKKRECFPSWSWTSVKTFHLLFAGRSRDMKGVPESHDIEVKLTRLDGTMVDLATFLVDPQIDYTHFQPWIDVTTWGFSTPKNESAFGFLESNCGAQVLENRYQRYWNVAGACIFLDYPGYQPRGRLTLIHIRLIDSNGREPVQSSSLIVEEVIAGSGQFKRVGRYLQCLGREMELSDYYNMSAPKFLDTYLDWDGEPKKMPPWEIIKLRLV